MQQFLLNSEMKLSSLNALYLVSKSDPMLRPDEVLFVNSLISVFNAEAQGTHPRLIVTSSARQVPPTIINKFQGISLARDQSSQTIFYNFNNSWLWQNTLVGSASTKANWEVSSLNFQKLFEELEHLPDQKLDFIRSKIPSQCRRSVSFRTSRPIRSFAGSELKQVEDSPSWVAKGRQIQRRWSYRVRDSPAS